MYVSKIVQKRIFSHKHRCRYQSAPTFELYQNSFSTYHQFPKTSPKVVSPYSKHRMVRRISNIEQIHYCMYRKLIAADMMLHPKYEISKIFFTFCKTSPLSFSAASKPFFKSSTILNVFEVLHDLQTCSPFEHNHCTKIVIRHINNFQETSPNGDFSNILSIA